MNHFQLSTILNSSRDIKYTYRKYEGLVYGLLRKKNQRNFLEECVREQVTPRMYGFARWTRSSDPFPNSTRIFLQEHIDFTKQDIYVTRRNISDVCNNLRLLCPNEDTFDYLKRFAFTRAVHGSVAHQAKLRNKMKRLISSSEWNNMCRNNNILNLSDRPLSVNEQIVLNLGISFALKPGKECYLDYIKSFDKYCASINFEKSDMCLKGLILNVFEKKTDRNPLPDRFIKAISSLKKSENIIISKSDKDGKIVILNKDLYMSKAMDLLDDTSTYEKLSKDPSSTIAPEFYKKVRTIGGNKQCKEILEKFKCINPTLPYFYGLPKTHKDGIPLRPIVSSKNSFMYKISKWLADLLSPFLGTFSSSHLKHSEDFICKFNNSNIPTKNVKLLSLDVESLFTKVPIDAVLTFLSNKLQPYEDHFPVGLGKTIDLIKLCVTNNVFSFNGSYFKQKFGCSMGNPLSPLLANLYMEYFETVLLSPIKPPNMIWYRYVDDIFSYWDEKWGNFDEFLSNLNSLVPSIKFKCEWEKDDCLPFLDVLIMRRNNRYVFTVYRKPTFSISYIHFLSYHDKKIKIGVACNLFLRALRICSPEFLDEEFNNVRQHLSYLKYPKFLIEKATNKAKSIFYRGKKDTEFQSAQNKIILPYSESINKISESLGKNNPIVFSYPRSIGASLINVYQNKKEITAGVYNIPCRDCDKSYYGQTGRSINQRILEHKRAVRYGQENSGIFQHVANTGHRINWDKSELIFRNSCGFKRKIIEAAVIKQTDNLNISEGQWKGDRVDDVLLRSTLGKIKISNPLRPPEIRGNPG